MPIFIDRGAPWSMKIGDIPSPQLYDAGGPPRASIAESATPSDLALHLQCQVSFRIRKAEVIIDTQPQFPRLAIAKTSRAFKRRLSSEPDLALRCYTP